MKISVGRCLVLLAVVLFSVNAVRAAGRVFHPALLNSQNINPQLEARAEALLKKLTLADKIRIIAGDGYMHTIGFPKAGIPALKMSDASVGVRVWGPSTAYPASVALAATWDPALAYRVGRAVGHDARARGVNIVLGPGMDVTREPQCGRNFEYLGEDPYLAGHMAAPWIRGLQSMRVAACSKHYAGNEQETWRGDVNTIISMRALHEIYLPPFRDAIKLGNTMTFMCAYNKVNGYWCSANHYLLTTVLRRRWHYEGLVMSDWGAVHDTLGPLTAGLDLEMPGPAYYNAKDIMPLLKSGKITEATINQHVLRLLRVMLAMGFIGHTQKIASIPLNDPSSRAAALQEETEAVVLLKNKDNILPLHRSQLHTIVVVGPDASPAVTGGGGSSYTTPIIKPISMLAAIKAAAGSAVKVEFLPLGQGNKLSLTHSVYQPTAGKPGWTTEYWPNANLTGAPTATGHVAQINFPWHHNYPVKTGPSGAFSARFRTTIKPTRSGEYLFDLGSDDGSRLFVDGKQVINNWRDQALKFESTRLNLTAGKVYRLRIEYYNALMGAQLYFGYQLVSKGITDAEATLIRHADVVIACVGPHEHEGSDRPFHLPGGQGAMLHEVGKLNPHTIVVVNAGDNVAMSHWIHQVAGLLYAWYPGENGNKAVAGIIFGSINPSGKLPDTFEKHWKDSPAYGHWPGHNHEVHFAEGIYVGYRWYDSKNIMPRYCFGFGLSYTTFAISHLQVSATGHGHAKVVQVAVRVSNTGKRAGAEVVQLYVRPPSSPHVVRTFQQLKGFKRVMLQAGQSKTVHLTLHWRDFAYFDVHAPQGGAWRVPAGVYGIAVGSSSRDIAQTADVSWR